MEDILFIKKNTILKMDDDLYFSRPEVNFSLLKYFNVSGRKFQYEAEKADEEPTEAMLYGSYVHALLLDKPAQSKFIPCPRIDRRTVEGKKLYQKFQNDSLGKTLISEELWNQARESASTLTPVAKSLLKLDKEGLSTLLCERSIIFEENGVAFKCKFDAYDESTNTLIDIKTTRDIKNFPKVIFQNMYNLQLAFYAKALKKCGLKVDSIKIIAIENEKPCDSTVYNLSQDVMDYSEAKIDMLIKDFSFQKATGFQGISEDKEIEVELPKYVL